jgi:hypothetical protein
MKNIRDVFSSVHDWSVNLTGLFFYIKNQLIEYESIMKISQSSMMAIHRLLKSKLLVLLSSIRKKIFDHQALHELERIVWIIETKSKSISTVDQPSMKTNRSYHKSIIKSCPMVETASQGKELFLQLININHLFFRGHPIFIEPTKSVQN